MKEVLSLLEQLEISYERFDHHPVYTSEEAAKLTQITGTDTKNLFLRNKKGDQHFLIVCAPETQIDLKALAVKLNSSKLSFGSKERLEKHLGIEAGAVSMLALVNDEARNVQLAIDSSLWERAESLQCHPLRNDRTLVIPKAGIEVLLSHLGVGPMLIDLP